MTAALLALGAALSWGLSDFLGGLKSRSSATVVVLLVSQVTALCVLTVTVAVRGLPAPDGRFLPIAALAGVGEVVGIAALYRGLAVGRMTVVAPVAATAPVLPLLVGLVSGEVPGPLAGVGLVLAITGVVVTSTRADTTAGPARLAPSVGYGLLSAAGFGLFFLTMDSASEGDVPWALLTARLAAVLAVGAAAALTSRRRLRRRDLPAMALIGLLIVTADTLYATATTMGLLGVAAVLGSLHTVVTIALASLTLDERLGRAQRIGVATALLGVLTIAAS